MKDDLKSIYGDEIKQDVIFIFQMNIKSSHLR